MQAKFRVFSHPFAAEMVRMMSKRHALANSFTAAAKAKNLAASF